jgi:hypothetical protein
MTDEEVTFATHKALPVQRCKLQLIRNQLTIDTS